MSAELRIVWHPQRMSGQPTIGDTRLDVDCVAGRVAAGEPVKSVAEDYEITDEQVRLACWWLASYDRGRERWKVEARKAWRDWAEKWHSHIWSTMYAVDPHPGDPPKVERLARA